MPGFGYRLWGFVYLVMLYASVTWLCLSVLSFVAICLVSSVVLLWIATVLVLVVGAAIVWALTRNVEYVYSGLFLAIFPFVGLLYNHFFTFKPQRDPIETQKRLKNVVEKQRKNARTVALVNGSMLVITSPFVIAMGIAGGSEYGIMGAVAGGVVGLVWLVAGLWGIAWWRRSQRKERGPE